MKRGWERGSARERERGTDRQRGRERDLALLIEGHDDHGGAVAFHQLGVLDELLLPVLFSVASLGFRTQDFGFRNYGFGFRASGSGFMVKELGFRVQDLMRGWRVWG